jgi:formylmethanofuran:tetrahydromethanopterin formyltransferase
MITAALAGAATIAASTATAIAHSRYTGKPIKAGLERYVTATMALLGMGLGMFIFMSIDKLN